MSTGLKANNDGSAAIQVGGTDYITISSTGAVAIPVSLTIAGQPSGGDYVMNTYVAPATWTKPTGLKAIKVTVVGAGGNGGAIPANPSAATNTAGAGGGGGGAVCYFDASAIPGSPITITAGAGTNSFGPLISATAGAAGNNAVSPTVNSLGGAGGTGTIPTPAPSGALAITGGSGSSTFDSNVSGQGANSVFGLGLGGVGRTRGIDSTGAGFAATGYGAGGGGALRNAATAAQTGGTGAPGVVIIEEFY